MPVNKAPATARDGTRRGRPTAPAKGEPSTGKAHATPLTAAQERFVLCWMVRRNSTRAYADSHPGANYSTCMSEGSRTYHDPKISQELRRLLDEEAKRLSHSSRKVTEHLAAIAFSAISDVFDADGKVIEPAAMPRDVAVAVKKLKRRELRSKDGDIIGHTVEVEMADKIQALRLLGLNVGLFADKVEHSADDALIEAMRAARARALAAS
jgi:terminase small subunit-like protein